MSVWKGTGDGGRPVTMVDMADYDALAVRLAEVEQDAARYRWLRISDNRARLDEWANGTFDVCMPNAEPVLAKNLDEAIDAARAAVSAAARLTSPVRVSVEFDLAPAAVEGRIRAKLMEMGWTPPSTDVSASGGRDA
jgi:hypothetical protein